MTECNCITISAECLVERTNAIPKPVITEHSVHFFNARSVLLRATGGSPCSQQARCWVFPGQVSGNRGRNANVKPVLYWANIRGGNYVIFIDLLTNSWLLRHFSICVANATTETAQKEGKLSFRELIGPNNPQRSFRTGPNHFSCSSKQPLMTFPIFLLMKFFNVCYIYNKAFF